MSEEELVNTGTDKYLVPAKARMKDVGAVCTHTMLTGGSFCVRDAEAPELRLAIAQDSWAERVPSISELRTPKFPMYLDLDFRLPRATIAPETVERIAFVCTTTLQRFYPNADEAFRCLVCTKVRGATADGDDAWKHGVHLHWPKVILDVEKALHVRLNIVHELLRTSWGDELGLPSPPWDDIVDEAVFTNPAGGLRMLFAPKARKCVCHGTDASSCDICHIRNRQHVSDRNWYVVTAVVRDGGADAAAVDADYLLEIKRNRKAALHATTVRCDGDRALTPGFTLFPGCVIAPPPAAGGGRKRGRGAVALDDSKKLSSAARKEEVTDKKVVEIVRRHLVRHSPHYAASRARIYRQRDAFKVLLSGIGARFCCNKGDFHTGNNVYMQIVRCRQNYVSQMRCWSNKQDVRPVGQVACPGFLGDHVVLTADERATLFPDTVTDATPKTQLAVALAAYRKSQQR